MGAIFCTINDFLETCIDIVGIKSGIVLTKDEVLNILKGRDPIWEIAPPEFNNYIRIRSETYEDEIRYLRISIGNLEDKPPAMFSGTLDSFFKRGEDVSGVLKAFSELTSKYSNQKVDPNVLISDLQKSVPHASLQLIIAVLKFFVDHQIESHHISLPERESWDGGTPLQDLFNCEINSGESFFDQKFLDYLAVNDEEIKKMHWRNFERFCAEFFNRLGCETELGPGTNDGGIDIRAFDPRNPEGSLILIQCKRYKNGRKVSIESVKSFYTDVAFEDASQGIIITSGEISAGGKKVVSARKYPLSFAEFEDVKLWSKSMWRHG